MENRGGGGGVCATREDDGDVCEAAGEKFVLSRSGQTSRARKEEKEEYTPDGSRAGCGGCRLERDTWCLTVHLAALRGWMLADFLAKEKDTEKSQGGEERKIARGRRGDCSALVFSSDEASALWLCQLQLVERFLLSDVVGSEWDLLGTGHTSGGKDAVNSRGGRNRCFSLSGRSGAGGSGDDAVELTSRRQNEGTPGPVLSDAYGRDVPATPRRLRLPRCRFRCSLSRASVRCHTVAWREVVASLHVGLIRKGAFVEGGESVNQSLTELPDRQPFTLRETQRRGLLLERVLQLLRRYCLRQISGARPNRQTAPRPTADARAGAGDFTSEESTPTNATSAERPALQEKDSCGSKSTASRTENEVGGFSDSEVGGTQFATASTARSLGGGGTVPLLSLGMAGGVLVAATRGKLGSRACRRTFEARRRTALVMPAGRHLRRLA